MKRPAFQFYPGDWLRDAALRMCSSAARGLWIDMIAIMHQAEPYGHLMFNGRAVDNAQLAKMVSESPREVFRWLAELEAAGVFSRDDSGVIYSRKMVRGELERAAWRAQQQAHRERQKPDTKPDVSPLSADVSGQCQPVLQSSVLQSSKQKAKAPAFSRPDWIDAALWDDYLAMRVRIRKPATDKAKALIVRDLERLKSDGFDPTAVLERSIANSWQGVFPPKAVGPRSASMASVDKTQRLIAEQRSREAAPMPEHLRPKGSA
jgi:hypothetical protein